MKQERRNIPDFDDLVFEYRNKDYGAYRLRKDYKWILAVSTFIAVFIACSLTIIPFYIEKSSNKVTAVGARYVPVDMDDFIPPREEYGGLASSPGGICGRPVGVAIPRTHALDSCLPRSEKGAR